MAVASVASVTAPTASADRDFAARYTTNATGSLTLIANTLETCQSTEIGCAAAQAGGPANNNGFAMRWVNVDPDGGRNFNSSSAQLAVPSSGSVLFAGLYWTGDTRPATGSPPAPNVAARNTVRLQAPGEPYRTITGAVDSAPVVSTGDYYQGFADVTSVVRAAGDGAYTVANVQSATGAGKLAGWALVVVYFDPNEVPRNLTVFDGLRTVNSSSPPQTITVSGFRTPPAGAVRSILAFVAAEGDAGTDGDTASLNGTTLSDAANPARNFFNSTVSVFGNPFTAKNPNFRNQLGFDADVLRIDGLLANNATNATIRLTTSGDTYLPGVVAFATDLYAPNITSDKTIENLSNPGGAFRPGDRVRYTLRETNSGQDGAANMLLRDQIPAQTTYVPGSLEATAVARGTTSCPSAYTSRTDADRDDTAEFESADQRVTFRLGDDASAASGGLLPAVSGGASTQCVRFVAQIAAATPDGTVIDNRSEENFFAQTLGVPLSDASPIRSLTVSAPDLTVDKSHSAPLVGGTVVPFTIDVSNLGGLSPSGTVTVTDTFPASDYAALLTASGAGWSCTISARAMTCTRADALAPGARYPPITVSARIADPPADPVTNRVTVANASDPNTSNNTAVDTGPGVAVADVSIEKSADPTVVGATGLVDFTLTATNNGPGQAQGVTVTDALAPNFQLVSVDPSQGSCDGTTTVTCALGTVSPDEPPVTVTLRVRPIPTTAVTLSNTATVTTTTDQAGATSNDRASASVRVVPGADLVAAKSGPAALQAGQRGSWTVSVINRGPSPATDVLLVDYLPLETALTPTPTASDPACTFEPADRTFACRFPTLASGATRTVTIGATIAAGAPTGDSRNAAQVSANERDEDAFNNFATAPFTIGRASDLSITKTGPADPVAVGGTARFSFAVLNQGPSASPTATVTDTLPDGLRFVSSTGGCVAQGQVLTCTRTTPLGPDSTWTFTVDTTPTSAVAGQQVTNAAAVSGPNTDLVGTDNTTSTSVTVAPLVDLSLVKTGPTEAVAGTDVTYAVRVGNAGPNPAGAVTINDPLPAGLTATSASTPQGSCQIAQTVTCDLGAVGVGTPITVTIGAHVGADQAGQTLENTASVSSAEQEADLRDNASSARTAITPQTADLVLTKDVSPATVTGPATTVFTLLVTNAGPFDATDVVVTDDLPDGLSEISATPSQGSCSTGASAEPVRCALGSLRPGQTATVALTASAAAVTSAQSRQNTATVSAAQPDPDAENNRAQATVTVLAPAPAPEPSAPPPVAPAGAVDLRVAKRLVSATPDGHLRYRVTVTNVGSARATGVTLTDVLAAVGARVVSAHTERGRCTVGLTTRCSLGDLPPGATITVDDDVQASRGGTVTNTATVLSAEADAHPHDNTAKVSRNLRAPRTTVTLTKRADHATARAGASVRFTLTARNRGRVAARDLRVCDAMPAALRIASVSGPGARQRARRVCFTVATLKPGRTLTMRVRAIVRPRRSGRMVANTAVAHARNAPRAAAMARVVLLPQATRPGFTG